MKPKIWLSPPHMGKLELKHVIEAFESNWIAPIGSNIDGFETSLSQFMDNKVTVTALSSGTAAIHLALRILGIQRGDEVICQSMTFCGTSNPILYEGAIPIFIDSEPDTWNMSPEYLEIAIKDRISKGIKPKAIIPVHLYGMPAKMDEIMEIARNYEIPVIEDAAEALGSRINGLACGTIGDIGVLSFNGNKIITTSSGGALVSKNIDYVDKARFFATQARDEAPHYEHSELGYNYRMSNICAGIGRGQVAVLKDRVEARRKVYNRYNKLFSDVTGVRLVQEPTGFYSNRWLTTIIFSDDIFANNTPARIRIALEKENIETRPLWKPMHLQKLYADCPYYGENVAEELFKNGLCLPSGSSLTEEEMDRICTALEVALSGSRLLIN